MINRDEQSQKRLRTFQHNECHLGENLPSISSHVLLLQKMSPRECQFGLPACCGHGIRGVTNKAIKAARISLKPFFPFILG